MSGFTGPQDFPRYSRGDARPPVHRPAANGPSLTWLRERYGERWELFEADDGGWIAVLRGRTPGFSWHAMVAAWDLGEFGTWLAEADRAVKERT